MAGGFSQRLKQARLDLAARLSHEVRQSEVAAHMGISRAAYSQWEGGATEPKSRKDYERLAKFFGVEPGWLAFGGGPEPRTSFPVEHDEEPVKPSSQRKRKRA